MRVAGAIWMSLFLLGACGSNGGDMADAADPTVAAGKSAHAPATPATAGDAAGERPTATAASILAWSRPAAGSRVTAPVNELVLHFSPPARLDEVTVSGPEGAMPMMVTAVGEVEHYSLPVSGLQAGSYTVSWRASAAGTDYRGSFGFQVK